MHGSVFIWFIIDGDARHGEKQSHNYFIFEWYFPCKKRLNDAESNDGDDLTIWIGEERGNLGGARKMEPINN